MAADWTIKTDLDKLNKVLTKFAEQRKLKLADVIQWGSLTLIGMIQSATPRRYGQAASGWLPFLWKHGVDVAAPTPDSSVAHEMGNVMTRQREGRRACYHKAKFSGDAPYASITNAVKHIVYLEYGVRKGAQKSVSLGEAKLSSVSGRMQKGFVKRSIKSFHKDLKAVLKKGA